MFLNFVTSLLRGGESVILLFSQNIFIMKHEHIVVMNAGESIYAFFFV